jgi:hypothetical protein
MRILNRCCLLPRPPSSMPAAQTAIRRARPAQLCVSANAVKIALTYED